MKKSLFIIFFILLTPSLIVSLELKKEPIEMVEVTNGGYKGDLKDGKADGYGVVTGKSGKRYEGEFKNGKANGKGKITYPDGEFYEGEIKDNPYVPR